MELFVWLESMALSTWMREYPSAFPVVLVLHALGMGFAGGIGVCVAPRICGIAAHVPLDALRSFFPALWVGATASAISGSALLLAYPAKALTNPVFFLKLLLIGVALRLLFVQANGLLKPGSTRIVTRTDKVQAAMAILAASQQIADACPACVANGQISSQSRRVNKGNVPHTPAAPLMTTILSPDQPRSRDSSRALMIS